MSHVLFGNNLMEKNEPGKGDREPLGRGASKDRVFLFFMWTVPLRREQAKIWVWGRRTSKYKGPEVGRSLVSLRNSKERKREEWGDGRGVGREGAGLDHAGL